MIEVDTDQAAAALRQGRVVIYPTDTLYGAGVDIYNNQAVAELFRLKGRDADKPVSVLIDSLDDLSKLVRDVSPTARRVLESFFPGPLTAVLPAASGVSPALCAGTGWIGIRQSSYPKAQDLVRSFGGPITATSANPSGKIGAILESQVRDYFSTEPELRFLSDGNLPPLRGSTVVKIDGDKIELLREGEIGFQEILKVSK